MSTHGVCVCLQSRTFYHSAFLIWAGTLSPLQIFQLLLFTLIMLPRFCWAHEQNVENTRHSTATSNYPAVVWLRPPEVGAATEGIRISEGPMYDNMLFLAKNLKGYEHRFEAYPIKRAWSLVKSGSTSDEVYCFFGASYREERKKWGYFSQPSSVNLPMLIVVSEGLHQQLVLNDVVPQQTQSGLFEMTSVEKLLTNNYRTVLYSEVKNAFTEVIQPWVNNRNVIMLNGLGKDLGLHTIALIKNGRIEFGHVGHMELYSLTSEQLENTYVYQVEELSGDTHGTKRLFCSKTPMGKQVTEDFNDALANIKQDKVASAQLREVSFRADGYPTLLKPTFDARWKSMQLYNAGPH